MINWDQSAHSAHETYGVITDDNASTVEAQASLNDSLLLPPEVASLEIHAKKVDSFVESLDAYRQRLHMNAQTMRELYHHLQRIMTEPSAPVFQIQDNDPFPSFTELGTSKGELVGAFQYHVPPSVNMDTLRPADAHRDVETPMYRAMTESVQHQTWGLLRSVPKNMLHGGHEALPWQGVMSEYERKITSFPPAYASYPQVTTSEHYGHTSDIGLDGAYLCLSQQLVSPNISIDTVEAGKGGDVQSTVAGSSAGGEVNEPSVVSFTSCGTKRYRCRCGFECASKERMDRHLDSLKHSERKHRCSCDRYFTRIDSLKRHKKGCNRRR